MNVNEIIQAAVQSTQSFWGCAVTMSDLFSPELLCSVTFNIAVLTLVLLGAVRLVVPFGEK